MQVQLTVAQNYTHFIEVDKFQNVSEDEGNETFNITCRWLSPFGSRPKEQLRTVHSPEATSGRYQKNVQPSTPPQGWHRITGPYSPLCSQQCKTNVDHV
jgi:hypothetical protein